MLTQILLLLMLEVETKTNINAVQLSIKKYARACHFVYVKIKKFSIKKGMKSENSALDYYNHSYGSLTIRMDTNTGI